METLRAAIAEVSGEFCSRLWKVCTHADDLEGQVRCEGKGLGQCVTLGHPGSGCLNPLQRWAQESDHPPMSCLGSERQSYPKTYYFWVLMVLSDNQSQLVSHSRPRAQTSTPFRETQKKVKLISPYGA